MAILAIPVENRAINCHMTSLVRACFTYKVIFAVSSFWSYDSVVLTLGCKLASFYYLYLLVYYYDIIIFTLLLGKKWG